MVLAQEERLLDLQTSLQFKEASLDSLREVIAISLVCLPCFVPVACCLARASVQNPSRSQHRRTDAHMVECVYRCRSPLFWRLPCTRVESATQMKPVFNAIDIEVPEPLSPTRCTPRAHNGYGQSGVPARTLAHSTLQQWRNKSATVA